MHIYDSGLLGVKQLSTPAGVATQFRLRTHRRKRRRAVLHDNANSFLRMSADWAACLRTFLRWSTLVALCLAALAGAALAQDLAQDKASPAPSEPAGTRIEVDEQNDVIRFFTDGEERAVLDADGLHVNGDIDFTGTITDGNRYALPRADERGAQ